MWWSQGSLFRDAWRLEFGFADVLIFLNILSRSSKVSYILNINVFVIKLTFIDDLACQVALD